MSTVAAARSAGGRMFIWLLIALGCIATGAILTGGVSLPSPLNLPPELVVLAVIFGVCAPLLASRWRTTFWVLLAWLMVEDLIRKFLGNDLRVYFLKDGIYLLLVIGLAIDGTVSGMWREATGRVRFRLYFLMAWTVVLAVPMFFIDWRIPLIGLKLTWEFVPLVVAAFVLARGSGGVRRVLTGIVALGIPACAIGIIQAYIGPQFLRPDVPTPFLQFEFTRSFDVVQPSGLFVSPGRFANMALLVLVASLALLVLTFRVARWRSRGFALAGVVCGGAAVWAEASKTGIILAAAFTVVAVIAPAFAERRPAVIRGLVTLGLVGATLIGVFAVVPHLSANRVQYFTATLDPNQRTNEWSARIAGWQDNTWRGIKIGGVIGAGTGTGSLGIQYVAGSNDIQALTGVDVVEGGYAVVAQQWGLVGLVLWLIWSISWVVRGWRSVTGARGSQVAAAGLLLLTWMVSYLFVSFVGGFQSFQDYVANSYFWIYSGILFALPWAAKIASDRTDAAP